MGFYFDEFEKDKKQHINLSEAAWYVIEQDIKNFYMDEKAESRSGFLNRIITNFYEESNASISIRLMNKREELDNILSRKSFDKIDSKVKEILLLNMIDGYEKELVKQSKCYSKGHGEKFRINVSNVELLKNDSSEDEYYDNNVGAYLKALFEEYSLLQTYEREKVFFRDCVDIIKKAILSKKKLKLYIKQKHSPKKNTYYTRKFYVSPYKIVQDTTKSYNYLIGISEEILDNNSVGEKTVTSFRISRIDKISICNSMNAFISKDKKEEIEKELLSKLPQFMAGDIVDVKVKFTKKGYEQYNRLLYLRPNHYTKVDGEELTYIFKCTEVQAINYFLKFCRDIEIIEPKSLRIKFIDRYKSALKVYEEEKLNVESIIS